MAEIEITRFPRIVTTNSQNNSEIKGGGGSSDFSIAKVTVTLSLTANPFPFSGCDIDEYEGESYIEAWDAQVTNRELNVPLYKGKAIFWANYAINPDEWGTIVCTGGVEYDSGEGAIIITGDGTITATEFGGDA